MTPKTREAIALIKASTWRLQLHADDAKRLDRTRISDEAGSILAALRMVEDELREVTR